MDFIINNVPDYASEIGKLINKDPSVVNENANKDSDVFNTVRDLTAGSVAKAISSKAWPDELWKAHVDGDIHLHDSDFFPYLPMTNCNLTNYEDMLHNGFELNGTKMTEASTIGVATTHITMIVQSIAGLQYGGQTIDNIDTLLATFAKKNYNKHKKQLGKYILNEDELDKEAFELTKDDIYKAMESLEYNVNSLVSSSGQTPFLSVGFGLGIGRFEREIQKAILQVRIEGLDSENGKKTAIFPKLLFMLKEGTNLKQSDPNYDIKQLAMECTAKRIYPDYLNFDELVRITGNAKSPMGCRSFLQKYVDKNGVEVNDGRGNIGVQTVNLPRIALEAEGDFNKFWNILDERLELIHKSAQFRIQYLKDNISAKNAPTLYKNGALARLQDDDDIYEETFGNKRGTISIGYIGLHEVATIMYGKDWQENKDAKEFTVDILKHMKKLADKWGNEEGIHYSNYGTPSESLTSKFCRLDRERFGDIDGITDKEYYTNSFHYTTEKEISPFDKIDFESEYLEFSSGGFITYVEAPSLKNNIQAMESIIDYGYNKVGYLGINSPIDKCFECGFEGDFKSTEHGFECPSCGNSNSDTSQVVKRLCGYLGEPSVRPIVRGRQKEIESRVKHM